MNSKVIKPKSPYLKNFVEFFLLLRNEGSASSYITYPNSNLCLGIYKNCFFHWKNNGHVSFFETNGHYKSSLIGHHPKYCQIDASGNLDSVCIIFKMTAIRHISPIPFDELLNQEQVFDRLFGENSRSFLESLFEEKNDFQRSLMLEKFLLPKFQCSFENTYIHQALDLINQDPSIRIEELARRYNVSRAKIFRDFKNIIGQAPKDLIRTIRFRKAIETLKNPKNIRSLTELGYNLGYADQSHFIKDFKTLAGTVPSKFISKTTVVNEDFIWRR